MKRRRYPLCKDVLSSFLSFKTNSDYWLQFGKDAETHIDGKVKCMHFNLGSNTFSFIGMCVCVLTCRPSSQNAGEQNQQQGNVSQKPGHLAAH